MAAGIERADRVDSIVQLVSALRDAYSSRSEVLTRTGAREPPASGERLRRPSREAPRSTSTRDEPAHTGAVVSQLRVGGHDPARTEVRAQSFAQKQTRHFMRYDDDRYMLGYRGGHSPSRASGLLAKVLSVTAAAVVLISAVAVSLVLFAVAVVALVAFGLYLWWKTKSFSGRRGRRRGGPRSAPSPAPAERRAQRSGHIRVLTSRATSRLQRRRYTRRCLLTLAA